METRAEAALLGLGIGSAIAPGIGTVVGLLLGVAFNLCGRRVLEPE